MTALGDTIRDVEFSQVRIAAGYDMSEVDVLLDALADAADAGQQLAPLVAGFTLPRVRLREGYTISEVDAFLDEVVGARPGRSVRAETSQYPPPVIQERRGLLSRLRGRR